MTLGSLAGGMAIGVFVLVTTYTVGRQHGADAESARNLEEVRRLERKYAQVADDASEAEAARLAVEQERDQLAKELEDAARADPDADRPSLGADSVRRLGGR